MASPDIAWRVLKSMKLITYTTNNLNSVTQYQESLVTNMLGKGGQRSSPNNAGKNPKIGMILWSFEVGNGIHYV